jgi:hypothetical protein
MSRPTVFFYHQPSCLTENGPNFLLNQLSQLTLRFCLRSLMAQLEADEDIGQLDSHGIGGDLRRADTAPNVVDFIRKSLENHLFQVRVFFDRSFNGRVRQTNNVDRHGPF